MLEQLFPRIHARLAALPLLGPHVEGFVVWLQSEGYPRLPIRLRVRELPRVDRRLRRRHIRCVEDVTASALLELAPRNSQKDVYLAAVVRSLARYLDGRGLLVPRPASRNEELVAAYSRHLETVRGFARSTVKHHGATAAELLSVLDVGEDRKCLASIGSGEIEDFVRSLGKRLSRESLQQTVGHLRSFLRYLASQSLVARGLDTAIDTPRLYRREKLPRALPWETVRGFLASIDRSTPMGKRDYAMFLLATTYGLRTSEIAGLRLDDIKWRSGRLRVPRPKTKAPLLLPLTDEVGAVLFDYLRHARPDLRHREVFLRVRAPAGPLRPTAVTEAFQGWVRRGGLAIPYQGPHCLRHSLAIRLLRRGASLKEIGDLLGHRSAESTCVYLRLHVEDLRDSALSLPQEVHS